MTAAIRLVGLTKEFAGVPVVRGVDLDIVDGEFFSLLGPSGSGKTTILRMVAGFEAPTSGRVLLAGSDVTQAPPFAREVNTVFQDYALFPHMSVRDNVEYGLRVKRVPKAERRRRADAALESVRLTGYGDRRPQQLSGGQRQRVALARALVLRPRVLLLDEPLGALDLKLRRQMQGELKQIQREVGITFVLVTHDQEEALTLSDRIAVVHDGRIEQVATPAELYERPASAFVADFVGVSNLLTGEVARDVLGRDGTFSVRPERVAVARASFVNGSGEDSDSSGDRPDADEVQMTGTVAEVRYLGVHTQVVVEAEHGLRVTALQHDSHGDARVAVGERVTLSWRRAHVVALDGAGAGHDVSTQGSPQPAASGAHTSQEQA